MSYFDPKVYNSNNLHEDDRESLRFWKELIINTFNAAREDILGDPDDELDAFGQLKLAALNEFEKAFDKQMNQAFFDILVTIIEDYDDEVQG
jgi:hypothetical protein